MIVLLAIPVILFSIFILTLCNAASDEDHDEEQAQWCREYQKMQEQRKQLRKRRKSRKKL